MESNSVVCASTAPILSNPQVFILPSHHHSMLVLLNQPSEAIAIISNPHSLCFIVYSLIIMNNWTLSLQILSNHSSQSTIWDLCSLHNPTISSIHDCNNQIHSLSINNTHRSIQWLMSYTMSNNSIHLHSHTLSQWSEHNSYTVMTMNTIDSKEKDSW